MLTFTKGPNMAGLGDAIQVLLEYVGSSDVTEFFLVQKLNYDLLENLKRELQSIAMVVDDAEEKQNGRKEVRAWLQELQDAVYYAEDVMDEICTEALRHRQGAEPQTKKSLVGESKRAAIVVNPVPSSPSRDSSSGLWVESQTKSREKAVETEMVETMGDKKRTVSNLSLRPSRLSHSFKTVSVSPETGIEKNMEVIVNRMEFLAKQGNELGLRESIGFGKKQSPRTSLSFFLEEDFEVVFGRESEKQAIIDLLLSGDARFEKLSVIPIVGEVGIGKTTLARLVFDDHKVSQHFDIKVWVQLPDTFDALMVTKAIFESLTLQPCSFKELNLLHVKLQETLRGKKFLLVLDDMCTNKLTIIYESWMFLLSSFEGAAKDSSVIVTTNIQSIASIVGTVSAYHMRALSNTECWSLFAKFAFGNESPSEYSELEAIGRQIAQQCHGLPLAVRALGAVLHFKRQVEDWSAMLDCLKHLSFSSVGNGIINLHLRLSYDHLPAHLKRCVAYCSILPPHIEFEKEKLVLLWMAEGLLQQPRANCRMEEIGDKYFQELLFRSFFQQSSGNKSCFVMHRLMNDLALLLSGEYCFRLGDDNISHISVRTRYLSSLPTLVGEDKKGIECSKKVSPHPSVSIIFNAIDKAKFLRTFLPLVQGSLHLNSFEAYDLLFKLKFLRVLSLSHYNIADLPVSISILKHLRYMDLSHTAIKILPESVCALYNLQTLILSNCRSLTELPKNMSSLIKLRHLHIDGTELDEMPKEMGRLQRLQTLSNFVVGKESGSTVTELGGLLYLHGTLHISKLQNMVSAKDAAEARLEEKTYLDELVLEWVDYNVDPIKNRDELEHLVPHTNLKKLSIKFYVGTRFPRWLGDFSFSNMVFLRLSNCKNCLELPPVGQLSSLKVLIIEWMNAVKRVSAEFYGKN